MELNKNKMLDKNEVEKVRVFLRLLADYDAIYDTNYDPFIFSKADISKNYDIILEIIDSDKKYYSVNRRIFYHNYEDPLFKEYCEELSKNAEETAQPLVSGVTAITIDATLGETKEPI